MKGQSIDWGTDKSSPCSILVRTGLPFYMKFCHLSTLKSRSGFLIGLVFILVSGFLTIANAAVVPGTKCIKAGLQINYGGKRYTCIKLGNRLYWDNGVRITTPTSPPTPTSLPTPTSKPMNLGPEDSDLQFIYGSTSSCGGEVGFLRLSKEGALKTRKIILTADASYSVTPLDYQNNELLFETQNCDSSKTGSIRTLWRMNLGNPNSKPQQVYALAVQGARDGMIVNAKIDLATNKTLVLAWIKGDELLFTAESTPLVIWSSAKQGWLNAGIVVTGLDVSTGWSLTIFGSGNSNWRSVYVDWRTEISGIGKVTLPGYGYNAQFQGRGSVNDVKTGLLKMPYIFSTDQGVYVCADYPSSSGAIIDVETNSRCNRISGYQVGQVATTFAGNGTSGALEAVISIRDMKAYIFQDGPLFSTWSPVQILRTVDLSSVFTALPSMYTAVSTHEISSDIGTLSPTLSFNGYFLTK